MKQIIAAAKSDPDNKPLTKAQLKKFKRVNPPKEKEEESQPFLSPSHGGKKPERLNQDASPLLAATAHSVSSVQDSGGAIGLKSYIDSQRKVIYPFHDKCECVLQGLHYILADANQATPTNFLLVVDYDKAYMLFYD